jgi:FKBP-type peptidyl-prolyl cis-trans isomerase
VQDAVLEEIENVHIHKTGFLQNDAIFDSSRTGKPFVFTIGHGVIRVWFIAVRTMAIGEISNMTVDSDSGSGKSGFPPIFPAKAKLHFERESLVIGD